jgi:hypothetical protein
MKLGTHMHDGEREGSLLILRFVGQRSRSQLLKIEQKFDTFFSVQYLKYNKLSTHMHHAERNKSHELEVCGSKVKITISKYRTVSKTQAHTNNRNRLANKKL